MPGAGRRVRIITEKDKAAGNWATSTEESGELGSPGPERGKGGAVRENHCRETREGTMNLAKSSRARREQEDEPALVSAVDGAGSAMQFSVAAAI